MSEADQQAVRAKYETFAHDEARGISPLYERLALAVARNPSMLSRLSALPRPKQQPNLLFAAHRMRCGTPTSSDQFVTQCARHWASIESVMLAKATQTNEPGRCATLLPILAALPQPLALLEVGASAGLCLLPDRYAYRYRGRTLEPTERGGQPPVFDCAVDERVPVPQALPEIVWRRGLDLNPLRVTDDEAMDWLRMLIWPEHVTRRANFDRAVAIARQEPPIIVPGDAHHDLATLAAEAPPEATLVIFHSAVLTYVPREAREPFVDVVSELDAVWLANEHPRVFPMIAERSPVPPPNSRFLLSKDGQPVGFAGPHGQSLDWIG